MHTLQIWRGTNANKKQESKKKEVLHCSYACVVCSFRPYYPSAIPLASYILKVIYLGQFNELADLFLQK